MQDWDMSENGGLEMLSVFVHERIDQVNALRSYAVGNTVSKLSPYLHHGQVSPRTVLKAVQKKKREISAKFVRRLVWRDLAYWQLHHWPDMNGQCIRPEYERTEWASDEGELQAW